jgi:hypothetical protein
VTARWLVLPAAVALGIAAETGWPAGTTPSLIAGDLGVGWLLLGGGAALWLSGRGTRMGVLLMLTGAAWFIATFQAPAAFLYCGPLVHVLFARPTGRLAGRRGRVVVVGTYVLSASGMVNVLDGALLFGALIAAAGVAGIIESARRRTGPATLTYAFAVVAGGVLGGASLARIMGSPLDDAGLLAYDAALAGVALGIVAEVIWRASPHSVLAGFVVDLGGGADAGMLRDRLATAIGDPSLSLGYAVAGETEAWVDDTGRAVVPPPPDADRVVTRMAVAGRELGFVAHDPAFVADPRLFGLIAAAAGLAISNSAMQAEIRGRVDELEASRGRLVQAADAQGRRLEAALENGVDVRLAHVAELLALAKAARPDDAPLGALQSELAAARLRLRDFSRGVYPATLSAGGLVAAIADLAARSPVATATISAGIGRHDPAVESTLYFVCSEALANIARHAGAQHASVELRQDRGGLVLRIEDDGSGGANPAAGSGLRGLADRVEALGGSLVVGDRLVGGTSVVATIPWSRQLHGLREAVA